MVRTNLTYTQEQLKKSIIQEKDDGENEFYLFDSMESYVTYADPRNILQSNIQPVNSSNRQWFDNYNKDRDHWCFDRDEYRDTYINRLNNWDPYPEVVQEIEKQKGEFLNDPRIKEAFKRLTTYRRNKKFTIDDGELIFERVMSGDPEYYQKNIRKKIKKGIRILLNFSQNCGQNYTTFAKNTVDMFKISYVFELMGIPVQILAGFVPENATDNRRFSATLFLLKSETEQINLQKAALISCPGMLRYHGFAAGALFFKTRINGGYGTTTNVSKKFAELAECDFLIGQENKADKVIKELLKVVEAK
jgi:hypothetical protein